MHSRIASIVVSVLVLAAGMSASRPAAAAPEALLLVDAQSGRVLHAENATYPWYPASITKLLTTYITLRAVKEGRIALDTLLTVSENALAQQPSKMGFPVGTKVTVDNALKMLMVKSANDMAVVLAEGVSGSVDAFSAEMNQASARLGMTQSTWVNPNGLPAEGQVTSARDMAILARTLIREFSEYDIYWHISAIKFGRRVMRNYNKLIDRYPGADGMKTGFICASGYNLVASATRNGRRLIAIVLGSPSGAQRAETAAGLLERGFNSGGLGWLTPALGTVDALQPIAAAPPNLREEICGRNRGRVRTDHAAEEELPAGLLPNGSQADSGSNAYASQIAGFRAFGTASGEKVSLLGPLTPSMEPIAVTVIPPAGAPANPEALLARSAKKRGVVARAAKGRKSLAISVSATSPTDEQANSKPASVSAPKSKPAPVIATPKNKPAAVSTTAKLKPATDAASLKPPTAKPKVAKPAAKGAAEPKRKPAAKPAPQSAAAAPPAR